MSQKTKQNQDREMNVISHISELRNRLIVTAIFFVLFFFIGFYYVKDIYAFFEHDFDFDFKLTILSPGEIIWIYFTIAGIVALICTLPVIMLQLWLFISPGLKSNEKKATLAYIPATFLLCVGGLVFGYFLFIKLILPFLLSLNNDMFQEMFTVSKYFKFLFRITIPFAILFEIPIISMFLTSLGIMTPQFMRKTRKYAYFILLIVGALVTPPDIFLQLVVAVPLFIIYEISIYLSSVVYRKKERKHQEFMEKR
ncbi:MAG TPA: twin-arginine translocase subunit TatC [Virgibacillus sp.]|nr:twin-arginine translocase subunit TatC [Virgibacillus sp.]